MVRRAHPKLRALGRGMVRLATVVIALEIILQGCCWWGGEQGQILTWTLLVPWFPVPREKGWWVGNQSVLADDRRTGWRISANVNGVRAGGEGPFLVETNSKGFRDQEHSYENPDRRFRIVALGGDTTFGDGLEESQSYVGRIERSLPGTEVVNLGVIGYSPDQQYLLLQDEGVRYEPDLVLQFFGWEDIEHAFWANNPLLGRKCYLTLDGGGLDIRLPQRQAWEELVLSSRVVVPLKTLAFILRFCFQPEFALAEPEKLAERPEAIIRLIYRTQRLCQNHGASYLAVYVPTIQEFLPLPPKPAREAVRKILQSLEHQHILSFVDTTPSFRQAVQDPSQPPAFDPQTQHLRSHGHRLIAEQVAAVVSQRFAHRLAASHDQEPSW